jgi:hypothetical protein
MADYDVAIIRLIPQHVLAQYKCGLVPNDALGRYKRALTSNNNEGRASAGYSEAIRLRPKIAPDE